MNYHGRGETLERLLASIPVEVAAVELETALVQRAVNGDSSAFDGLARKCRPWLFGLCFRLLRDREAAEDSVQEALTGAFTGIAQLREPARFRAWLSRIALNACRMHMRRMSSVPESAVITELMVVPEKDSGRSLTEVDDALARIDHATRRMLLLFYDEGLSHAELAVALSLSSAAVKSRLHRARERLRKEMLKMITLDRRPESA